MELFHDLPTWPLIACLLLLTFLANELGYRWPLVASKDDSELSRNAVSTVKGSVFGLAGLLLAFSFSLTATRHFDRRHVVLDEANSLGTTYLRANFLNEPARTEVKNILSEYVDVRLQLYEEGNDPAATIKNKALLADLLDQLWSQIATAFVEDKQPTRLNTLVQSTNETIDLAATRDWLVSSHLQTPVLVLLLASILMSSLLIGHSSGLSGKRHWGMWAVLNILMALVLFVVLDFDRPRRGLIQVRHVPLIELRESIAK